MPKNYIELSQKAKSRGNPEAIAVEKSFSDELGTLSYSDILTYIRIAMNGVEPEYTRRSTEAGEKVKAHLDTILTDISYQYQGSVMTNTHIKGNSDIDLLVITEKFYYYDKLGIDSLLSNSIEKSKLFSSQVIKLENERSISSYTGNALEDLKKNRLDSERKMIATYSICDTKHAKAIKITNLSLKRDVDIVIATWYDDIPSILNSKGSYRGIKVYNKTEHNTGKVDFPFLSIERINQRSSVTNGRLKKMIRFLKTVKVDSEKDIKLSSFDINAICYDIEIKKYESSPFYELVRILYYQIHSICNDPTHSDRLISVDEKEYIFRGNSDKLTNLKLLLDEIQGLFTDLRNKTRLV
jgi:hypothetical protein